MARTNPSRIRTRTLALALVATVPFAGVACSSESVSDRAAEKIVEAGGGGEVDIDTSEGRVEVSTEDGSYTAEAGGELPEDWPADIPLPNEYTVETVTTLGSDAGKTTSVILRTAGLPDTVFASLEPDLADWTEESRMVSGVGAESFVLVTYQKGDLKLSITASHGDGDTVLSYATSPADA